MPVPEKEPWNNADITFDVNGRLVIRNNDMISELNDYMGSHDEVQLHIEPEPVYPSDPERGCARPRPPLFICICDATLYKQPVPE